MKPSKQRRYIEREYTPTDARELFNIPNNEFMINLKWDKERNRIVLETITDFNRKKGDI